MEDVFTSSWEDIGFTIIKLERKRWMLCLYGHVMHTMYHIINKIRNNTKLISACLFNTNIILMCVCVYYNNPLENLVGFHDSLKYWTTEHSFVWWVGALWFTWCEEMKGIERKVFEFVPLMWWKSQKPVHFEGLYRLLTIMVWIVRIERGETVLDWMW